MLIFRPNKHPKPVITVASIWLEFEARKAERGLPTYLGTYLMPLETIWRLQICRNQQRRLPSTRQDSQGGLWAEEQPTYEGRYTIHQGLLRNLHDPLLRLCRTMHYTPLDCRWCRCRCRCCCCWRWSSGPQGWFSTLGIWVRSFIRDKNDTLNVDGTEIVPFWVWKSKRGKRGLRLFLQEKSNSRHGSPVSSWSTSFSTNYMFLTNILPLCRHPSVDVLTRIRLWVDDDNNVWPKCQIVIFNWRKRQKQVSKRK